MTLLRIGSGRRANLDVHALLFGGHERLERQRNGFSDRIDGLVRQLGVLVQRRQPDADDAAAAAEHQTAVAGGGAGAGVPGAARPHGVDVDFHVVVHGVRCRLTATASRRVR